jgi:hypothetical protein
VTKDEELNTVVVEEFAYNFFPCAFDVNLSVAAGGFKVGGTFGTAFDNKEEALPLNPWTPATHRFYSHDFREMVMTLLLCCKRLRVPHLPDLVLSHILTLIAPRLVTVAELNTCFPSAIGSDPEQIKGGLILMKLVPDNEKFVFEGQHRVQVRLTYTDHNGGAHLRCNNLELNLGEEDANTPRVDYHSGPGIHKGIVLQKYVASVRAQLADKKQAVELADKKQAVDKPQLERLHEWMSKQAGADEGLCKVRDLFGRFINPEKS